MTGTLPVSGALSTATIQSTFGLTGALSLSQLYRGGSIIPSGPTQNANVPTSGAISFSQLYGATDVASPTGFTFSATISANTQNYNVATAATAAGWNRTEALFARVTVNGGVVVGSNSTGSYAFTIPSLPANSTVTLVCDGYIVGCGGAGGVGGSIDASAGNIGLTGGSNGGPGLLCQYPTTLEGSGQIGGGGGGGGGGGSGSETVKSPSGPSKYAYYGGGGGGGGAGYNSGAGGAGGTASQGTFSNTNGAGGASGSTTGGGAGGAASGNAVNGAAGGSLGNAGGASTDGGGAAGYAVTGNGNISYQWSGTIYGPTQ